MICRWSNKTKRFEPEPRPGDTLFFPAGSMASVADLARYHFRFSAHTIVVESCKGTNKKTVIGDTE